MVKKLKELRVQKGISQQKLASILGISQQSVNKYENHSVEPDIRTMIALAEFFDTTIDYLVGREAGKEIPEPDSITLSECRLIAGYRQLSHTEQRCVDAVVRTFLEQGDSGR